MLALSKGKKEDFNYQGKTYPISFYMASHTLGYALYFENLSKSSTLKAKFIFETENLQIIDPSDKKL